MSWLLALLAFSGIMAVLATIVSTLVELVHKVASSRSGGLRRMCADLHPALSAAFAGVGATEVAAQDFASTMINRPAPLGVLPGRTNFMFRGARNPRFERLSAMQFAEQLAATDIGDQLAVRSPGELRQALRHAAFQFERYGQAQSAYFRRRTKLISAAVALAVVALGNINGFAIYQHLARSEEVTESTLAFLSGPRVEALEEEALDATDRIQTLSAEVEGALANPTPEAQAGLAAALRLAEGQLSDLTASLDETQDSLGVDQRLALPLGWAQYPYCIAGDATNSCAQAPQVLTIGQGNIAWSSVGELLFWLLSLIGTAGLLALGAPFWFDAFRTLAAITTAARGVQATADGARAAAVQERAARGEVRDAGRADPEALAEAFLSARGVVASPAGVAEGGRVGDSSAEAVSAVMLTQGRSRPVRL
jgi:hypothetical protein